MHIPQHNWPTTFPSVTQNTLLTGFSTLRVITYWSGWASGRACDSIFWLETIIKGATHSQLNRAILLCDVIPDGKTDQNALFWQAIAQALELSFPVVFHTENCAVHSGNPIVSSVYLPTPRWHHLQHPFLAIHSADEHRMIYSFPITTSYSTFYAFFSSFRIISWPMWLANSKRQPCLIHHSHTHKKTNRTDKKTDKPDGKTVLCQKTFNSVIRAVCLHS